MSRKMFLKVTEVWNAIHGCQHRCIYCWAERLVKTRLRNSARYKHGFDYAVEPEELDRKFKPGGLVFVTDMGDLFGSWVPKYMIDITMENIRANAKTNFLLQTKNPERYVGLLSSNGEYFPENVYLGATIESNRDYPLLSKAPSQHFRYGFMGSPLLKPYRIFVSIEPILDFDLDDMLKWMNSLHPSVIEIGADNYKNNLPEPSWDKVEQLTKSLRDICPEVNLKPGLDRLIEGKNNG